MWLGIDCAHSLNIVFTRRLSPSQYPLMSRLLVRFERKIRKISRGFPRVYVYVPREIKKNGICDNFPVAFYSNLISMRAFARNRWPLCKIAIKYVKYVKTTALSRSRVMRGTLITRMSAYLRAMCNNTAGLHIIAPMKPIYYIRVLLNRKRNIRFFWLFFAQSRVIALPRRCRLFCVLRYYHPIWSQGKGFRASGM